MSLWIDGPFATEQDLLSLDAEVRSVADASSPALSLPVLIQRATEEVGQSIRERLVKFGGTFYGVDSNSAHNAAVANTGQGGSGTRFYATLQQVVVDADGPAVWSTLKRWVVYWALYLIYRDAAVNPNTSERDRYAAKAKMYEADAYCKSESAVALGLPVVGQPLPCPGAVWDIRPGTWGSANVTEVSGAGTLTADFQVVITWTSSTMQQNNESAPSATVSGTLTPGQVLHLDFSTLVVPNGQAAQPLQSFSGMNYGLADGIRIYVGLNNATPRLQYSVPITASFQFPGDPTTTGQFVGIGQWPDKMFKIATNRVFRG